MTDEALEAIKARADAATPGPWVENCPIGSDRKRNDVTWTFRNLTHSIALCRSVMLGQAERDAAFIAHAREDIPALLAEVEAWRALARASLTNRGTLFESDAGWLHCVFCDRAAEMERYPNEQLVDLRYRDPLPPGAEDGLAFLHTPDCPVSRARALLGD